MKRSAAKKHSRFIRLREKIIRLKGDPVKIYRGFALGSFIGVSPLIGMQVLICLGLSTLLRISRPASVIGVLNTNWTKGLFLYPVNYRIGAWILGNNNLVDFTKILHGNILRNIINAGPDVFISMLIGGFVTGAILAVAYYYLVHFILTKFRKNETQMKTNENQKYALITGASQGLGKALAEELASRKTNLLLVSLPGEYLEETSREIAQKHNIAVHFLEKNLAEQESVFEIAEWARNFNVNILINNAGVGGTRAFEQATPGYLDNIILVNVRATSMLTRLMLPLLKQNRESYILNVASMASFSPFAFKTVYPASKAFVYSFSRGLHEELRGTGVHVSVIHPGPIKTNPDVTARIEKQGLFGKMGLISPANLAHIAVRQMLKNDSLILPGFFNKMNWLFMSIVPNYWKLLIVSRVVRREISAETSNNQLAISQS
ncbi:hypothetical protein SDC9_58877 [bioreactor metagenome]|uniref:DUF2062 domain-containing protein n=1 Tax=bioreactor metagenome TaxID=1076179 RepID=A0A644XEB7_9ZZZZ